LSQCAVDGLAVLVDGAVEILPMALDLNVCFIHSATFVHREFLAFPKGCLQLRRELLDSAVNVGMVNLDAELFHHFLYALARWKYKRLKTSQRRAQAWVKRLVLQNPALFAHWQITFAGITKR